MEQKLHLDGRLNGSVAGWRALPAALLLACFSLVICALIVEAGLRASAAKAALPSPVSTRVDEPGVRAWLAGHSVLYRALRQRAVDAVESVTAQADRAAAVVARFANAG